MPCGRYLWDTRNADLVDWLVNEHLTGNSSVGRADGLISGIFLDDDISATGGFAENCQLGDCEHDMGLTSEDMQQLADGWAHMMNRTQQRVLDLGGTSTTRQNMQSAGVYTQWGFPLISATHLHVLPADCSRRARMRVWTHRACR